MNNNTSCSLYAGFQDGSVHAAASSDSGAYLVRQR